MKSQNGGNFIYLYFTISQFSVIFEAVPLTLSPASYSPIDTVDCTWWRRSSGGILCNFLPLPPFDKAEQRETRRDRDNAFFRPHFLQSDSLRIGQWGRYRREVAKNPLGSGCVFLYQWAWKIREKVWGEKSYGSDSVIWWRVLYKNLVSVYPYYHPQRLALLLRKNECNAVWS